MYTHPRKRLSKIILILTLILSACGSLIGTPATPTQSTPTETVSPPTPTPPPLAATVNGEWITEDEFLAEVDRYRTAMQSLGNESSADEAARIVLDDMIDQLLLAQAAREAGLDISEADLQSRIDALAADLGDVEALSAWQSEHGYTDQTFRFTLKQAAEAARMRDKIITTVPDTAEQVHAQQILLYNEDTAHQVVDQLNAGANFSDVAALYDPVAGGELGWFPRGYLLEPELEQAAFNLEPGQHSDVIASEVGYHIIYVIEHDIKYPLSPDAYLLMQEKALQEWLEQRRAESEIVLAP